MYPSAPCVKVSAAMTEATPMKMPSIVKNERRRFDHSAPIALPVVATSVLPGRRRRTRSSASIPSIGDTLAADLSAEVGDWLSNFTWGELLLTASPPSPSFPRQMEHSPARPTPLAPSGGCLLLFRGRRDHRETSPGGVRSGR